MQVIVWSKATCSQCIQAKTLLDSKGISYEERQLGAGWTKEQLLEIAPGARSVPQIFVDGKHVGGYQQLCEMLS